MTNGRDWVSITLGGAIATLWWRIWYSKAVFRGAWLAGNYITSAKIEAQKESGLGPTVVATAAAYWVLSLGIHYWLDATRSESFWQVAGNTVAAWALIAGPLMFLDFLWEFRRFDLMCLDAAHLLTVFMTVASVYYLFRKGPWVRQRS